MVEEVGAGEHKPQATVDSRSVVLCLDHHTMRPSTQGACCVWPITRPNSESKVEINTHGSRPPAGLKHS